MFDGTPPPPGVAPGLAHPHGAWKDKLGTWYDRPRPIDHHQRRLRRPQDRHESPATPPAHLAARRQRAARRPSAAHLRADLRLRT